MITIVLSSAWTQGGQTRFEAREGTLREVLRDFAASRPAYRHRLLDGEGEPLGYFNVYLDEEFVPRGERATTPVRPGATVTIVPPLAGG
ncbi:MULTISPECIES: MoaD/ThiS family protein [unclassified Nocardiopsis]|uniref:MoaD/ThiS family protein n=1 Tax=unclassified Nocardiopsis TaxID=2649073 RepID=UPI0013590F9C|nr:MULTISPECIES: MoaD/ThiS family protein [unclassified Nocardiopsis]